MKKALLLTDGSIDMALSLNRWLKAQTEPVNLTVVYAFNLNVTHNLPLKAAAFREAKQMASDQLTNWMNFLLKSWSGQLHTEILLGDPELVLTIHLLLRQYDYLLMEGWQESALSSFKSCQEHICTQVHFLDSAACIPEPDDTYRLLNV